MMKKVVALNQTEQTFSLQLGSHMLEGLWLHLKPQ